VMIAIRRAPRSLPPVREGPLSNHGDGRPGNRERPFSNCADQQIEPSQRPVGVKAVLNAKAERPFPSRQLVSEYSVGGMSVLVACDLNLHHYAIDFIYFGFEAGSVDP